MSNLRIFYPHIPNSATRIRTSSTFDAIQGEYNLITGPRYLRAQLASAQTTRQLIEYDLGASGAQTADYLAIARADLLTGGPTLVRLQGSSASVFTPTDVGTPAVWFDACKGVTYNGSNQVSQWDDQSGNARHATQSTSSKKPTYTASGTNGLPHIDFAGSDDGLSATGFTLAQPNTVFVVAKQDTGAANEHLFSSDDGAGAQNLLVGAPSLTMHGGSLASTGLGVTTGTTYVFSMLFNGASSKFFRDGTQHGGTLSVGALSMIGLCVGNNGFTYTQGHDGTICELIVYNSALSDANRQKVEAYLTTKWKTTAIAEYSVGATLYGPNDRDYMQTFTASSSFRYWWTYYATTASTKFPHSKVYFGNQINFSNDATVSHMLLNTTRAEWGAGAGAKYLARAERPIYEIEAEWQGLTDTEIATFLNNVAKNRHRDGFFLYTEAEHQQLDSQRIIHCLLRDFEWKKVGKKNYNQLVTVWREMVG